MKLSHYIAILTGVIVTSCYLFPFVLAAFPIANSKMIMAAIGIVLCAYNIFSQNESRELEIAFMKLSVWALGVSLIALLATAVNNTHDYTYATYIVSMWVWIGGGYTAVIYIKKLHGHLNVSLVVNYLLAVCVMQCILALVFDMSTAASNWKARTFSGEAFMGATDDRLSGIGCALDVAGLRFSAVLIMAANAVLRMTEKRNFKAVLIYISSLIFIVVIGSMISRTTAVGGGLAIVYLAISLLISRKISRKSTLIGGLLALSIVAAGVSTYLYRTNQSFHDNLRFGFEGFFSMAEKGEWQTHSNDILESMVVWPDNAKTWLIGDGYIENPLDKSLDTYDPYYVGPGFRGYYMQTDIGYCRFIFYFGLIGLAVFCLYFVKVCDILARRFPQYRWMFYLVLAMNFIGWCKVSSDLFMVFAPFLCISSKEEEEADEIEALSE